MSPFIKKTKGVRQLEIVKTNYISQPIPIPASFLSTTAATARQISYTKIDFSQTPLPEYHGLYAAVLDHVLSPSECATLIRLAQRSAGGSSTPEETSEESSSTTTTTVEEKKIKTSREDAAEAADDDYDGWQPAMVNAGPGAEFLALDYRNSDRIIWDEGMVVQRLLERCFSVGQVRADLEGLDARHEHILGKRAVELGQRWRVTRLNERMRFLRYGPGHFFKEHCDGTYGTPDGRERTFYTLHLYLNDSTSSSASSFSTTNPNNNPPLNPTTTADPTPPTTATATKAQQQQHPPFPALLIRGGATTFHSHDLKRRLDVDPQAGRVLIFQHRGLLHSGDEVREGIKYTMRTDLLFERDDTAATAATAAC